MIGRTVLLLCGLCFFISPSGFNDACAQDGWGAQTLYEIDSKIQKMAFGGLWKKGESHIAFVTADGRCIVLKGENKVWKQMKAYTFKKGLSSITFGDCIHQSPGDELIVGAPNGLVFVMTHEKTHQAGKADSQINDLMTIDVFPDKPGMEILALTENGKALLMFLNPNEWESLELLNDEGRLRNAAPGPKKSFFVAGISGAVHQITFQEEGFKSIKVFQHENSIARMASYPSSDPKIFKLLLADDNGQVFLLTREQDDIISSLVYKADKALRGIAASDFDLALNGAEIAIYGYDKAAVLLHNGKGNVQSTLLFKDKDRGHWLISGQIIPETKEKELLIGGYSGKLTLLYRDS